MKLRHFFCAAAALLAFVPSPAGEQDFVLDVPLELAGHGLALEGSASGSAVSVPLTGLGMNGTDYLRVGVDLTGLDPGAPVVLIDPLSGLSYTFTPTLGGSLTLAVWDLLGTGDPDPLQFSFAVDGARGGHVLALVLPEMGLTFPVTRTGVVGLDGVDAPGNPVWNSLGFFNALAHTGLASLDGSYRLVDLSSGEQGAANVTNLNGAQWGPRSVEPHTRAVTIVVPYEDPPVSSYTLHSSSGTDGSLQSVTPVNGPVQSAEASFTSAWCTSVSGQAGVGETFWLSRDRDGAISARMVMESGMGNAGPVVVDWSGLAAAEAPPRTESFQIGAERANHVLAVTKPGAPPHYLYPDPNHVWDASDLVSSDNAGTETHYGFNYLLGQVDPGQTSWSLVDETTGEDFGQTHQVLTGFTPWLPASQPGMVTFPIPDSRKGHALRLQAGDGEPVAVTVEAGYEAQGVSLSYTRVATSPGLPFYYANNYLPSHWGEFGAEGEYYCMNDWPWNWEGVGSYGGVYRKSGGQWVPTGLMWSQGGATWYGPGDVQTDAEGHLRLVSDNSLLARNPAAGPSVQQQTTEVRYVPARAPMSVGNGGFTLIDDTMGDSHPLAAAPVNFSEWYLPPAKTVGLRVSMTRWDHQLFLLHPNGESTPIRRGNLQGSWAATPAGGGHFSHDGWFDATALVYPGVPWVFWDATRQKVLSPDAAAGTDFITGADNTDTDHDGLPDWYEFLIGTDPNSVDSDGDGYSDRDEVSAGTNPLQNTTTPVSPLSGEYHSFGSAPLSILLGTDGAEVDGLTYEIVAGPGLGTLSGEGRNLSYQRTADGEDTFQFVIHQGSYTSPASTITIHAEPAFKLRVPVEVAGHGLSLQGFAGENPVNVPLLNLNLAEGGALRKGMDLTGVDAGSAVTLNDPLTGWSYSFVPDQASEPEPDTASYPYQGPGVLSFAVSEDRAGHVLGLVLPEMGLVFPVTVTAPVGSYGYDAGGNSVWNSLGFFNAYAQTGLETIGGTFLLVDLTSRRQSPANTTNLMVQTWQPLTVNLLTRAVTVVVPYEETPATTYTLHTSSGYTGSLQSTEPVTGALSGVTPQGAAFTSASCTSVGGQVGIGETFWLTRDIDGAASQSMLMGFNSGTLVVDWSAAFVKVESVLIRQSFQIGSEREGHVFAVVEPDGTAHYLYPDWNHTWDESYLLSSDSSGAETHYLFNYMLGEVDASQEPWSLVDVTTGEDFGQTHQVLDGFAPWLSEPRPGRMYFPVAESRQGHGLRLQADTGDPMDVGLGSAGLPFWYGNNYLPWHWGEFGAEGDYYCMNDWPWNWEGVGAYGGVYRKIGGEWVPTGLLWSQGGAWTWGYGAGDVSGDADGILRRVSDHSPLATEGVNAIPGAALSYSIVATGPDGTSQPPVEVRYVVAAAPATAWNGGFTLHDDTTGDSRRLAAPPLNFSQWYQPADETLGLKVSATRRANQLFILYPNGESTPLQRGNLQGLWSTDQNGRAYFSDYGWFAATALVPSGVPWVLWDATRNEILSPDDDDHGEPKTKFIGSSDNTDTDGDGLPDWYEFMIGTNANNASTSGSGIPDGWAISHGLSPFDASQAGADPDGDGLTNLQEYLHGTDPHNADTDGDGVSDSVEVQLGTAPITSDAGLQSTLFTVEIPREFAAHGYWIDGTLSGNGSAFQFAPAAIVPIGDSVRLVFNRHDDTGGHLTLHDSLADTDVASFDFDATSNSRSFSSTELWDRPGRFAFAVDDARRGHVLGLYLESAGGDPVTTLVFTVSQTGSLTREDGSGNPVSVGFFNVLADTNQLDDTLRPSARLVDLTTSEMSAPGTTNLVGATWSPIDVALPVRQVTLFLGQTAATSFCTLHTTSEALESLWPEYVLNPATNEWTLAVRGQATVGEMVWVTRDNDTLTSPPFLVDAGTDPFYADFTALAWGNGSNTGLLTFSIGQDHYGESFRIVYPDGTTIALMGPDDTDWWAWWGQNALVTQDDGENEVDYFYANYTAQVDLNQTGWSLVRDGDGRNYGQVTQLLDGFTAWHPSPPAGRVAINVPVSRGGDSLKVRDGQGNLTEVIPDPGYGANGGAYLSAWNRAFAGSPDERVTEFRYYPATASIAASAVSYVVEDQTRGDESPAHSIGSTCDLGTWFSESSPVLLRLPAPRWNHQLFVHTANGDEYPVTRDVLDFQWTGSRSGEAANQWDSATNHDGGFSAVGRYRIETDWWVWDATTGEASAVNQGDLNGWPVSSVSKHFDRNGRPNADEQLLGTYPFGTNDARVRLQVSGFTAP